MNQKTAKALLDLQRRQAINMESDPLIAGLQDQNVQSITTPNDNAVLFEVVSSLDSTNTIQGSSSLPITVRDNITFPYLVPTVASKEGKEKAQGKRGNSTDNTSTGHEAIIIDDSLGHCTTSKHDESSDCGGAMKYDNISPPAKRRAHHIIAPILHISVKVQCGYCKTTFTKHPCCVDTFTGTNLPGVLECDHCKSKFTGCPVCGVHFT